MRILLILKEPGFFEGWDDVRGFRLYKQDVEDEEYGVLQIWRAEETVAEEFWYTMEDDLTNVEAAVNWAQGDGLVFHVENYLD